MDRLQLRPHLSRLVHEILNSALLTLLKAGEHESCCLVTLGPPLGC